MANVSKPSGLKPVSYLNGSPYNGQARLYYVPTGNGTALYVGDPVTVGGGSDTNGLADVVAATAGVGNPIVGVVVGVVKSVAGVSLVGTTIDLTTRSLAASTAGYIYVADDPNLVFEIQSAHTVALVAADIGLNCNVGTFAAGAGLYSDSGTQTETAVPATAATSQLKILGLAQREDNAFGTYAKLLVKINNHQYGSHTGTAGV